MLFQKSDGTHRLILWVEKSGFDPFTRMPLTVAPRQLMVKMEAAAVLKSVSAYQDDGSVQTSNPSRNSANEYPLVVGDNLTIVEVSH
jgi:hypothetical protein